MWNCDERQMVELPIGEHTDVVEPHHRFSGVRFGNNAWDLSHLDAFALRLDPGLGFEVDVVVLFSCHCFTRGLGAWSAEGAERGGSASDFCIFDNGRERRVLDEERYRLSRDHLPRLIKELEARTIRVAGTGKQNFVTLELLAAEGDPPEAAIYGIFFEVKKDTRRKKRILLHVQSAYRLDSVRKRLEKAGKATFKTLLRKAYLGEKIRG